MPTVGVFRFTQSKPNDSPSRRAPTRKLYYSRRWRDLRKLIIHEGHALCVDCGEPAGVSAHVDHIIPHRGDPTVFFDEANLQVLCHRCHSKKTAREQAPPMGG